MATLEPAAANELNRVMAEFKSDPPTESEVRYVLDDFERFFSFALLHIQDELSDGTPDIGKKRNEAQGAEEEHFGVQFEAVRTFPKPKLTGDVRHDLNLLHPYQVAYAIKHDNPSSIAVVIRNLTDAHAAKTLEMLPADVQRAAFLQLAQTTCISQRVQQQILEATLKSAMRVETRVPEQNRTGQMVALVRSLPKNIRNPLMESLLEQDRELAQAVKAELYQFDDLLRLEDRDLQKVLAQSSSDALVIALVDASDDLKTKLFNNMSKRARQTIEDELQFKANANPVDIAAGKKQIVEILMRMDEAGEINLR
jgi:flagellar motor switch protein FliG